MSQPAAARTFDGHGEAGCAEPVLKTFVILLGPHSQYSIRLECRFYVLNGATAVQRVIAPVGTGVGPAVQIEHNGIKAGITAFGATVADELGDVTYLH
jgi:hypothetical protein